jgi:LmbE family N-acetylglucosaminyl deacetylase
MRMAGDTILLSPHLDDAVLSAWSLLQRPGPVRVVNVFAGTPPPGTPLGGWDAKTGASDSHVRATERIAEDREALALAGREPLNLDFLDEQYRSNHQVPVGELTDGLLQAALGAAELHAPAGIRGHRDHVAVRDVARMLARRWEIPLLLYAEQPYATRHGWPGWVDGSEPNDLAEAEWERAVGALDATPEAVRLDPRAVAAKLQAMRTYRTQFEGLEPHSLRGLSDPAMFGIEVRFRLA